MEGGSSQDGQGRKKSVLKAVHALILGGDWASWTGIHSAAWPIRREVGLTRQPLYVLVVYTWTSKCDKPKRLNKLFPLGSPVQTMTVKVSRNAK